MLRFVALLLWSMGAFASPWTLAPMPTLQSVAGLPTVGRIDAKDGQVIERVHVTNPNGPCVVVYQGRKGVVIRDSEIGPCGGSAAVFVLDGATDITVLRNVIHDAPRGVLAYKAAAPMTIGWNIFYAISGAIPAGQDVQITRATGGAGRIRVVCNLMDGTAKGSDYEDHVSLHMSSGTAGDPIEVAWNRIRGGQHQSGSGIMLGDQGGSYQWAHDNVIVITPNVGVGVVGGDHIAVEGNLVANAGADPGTLTHDPFAVRGFTACSDVSLTNNRGIGRRWAWGGKGDLSPPFKPGPEACDRVAVSGNAWQDTTLDHAMFDNAPTACR